MLKNSLEDRTTTNFVLIYLAAFQKIERYDEFRQPTLKKHLANPIHVYMYLLAGILPTKYSLTLLTPTYICRIYYLASVRFASGKLCE